MSGDEAAINYLLHEAGSCVDISTFDFYRVVEAIGANELFLIVRTKFESYSKFYNK